MSPPLTGHRDDCSGAQRASWHPVLSLLSQSLSHPSLPFCLLLRQALMHAYIIGLGKAWGAGTGRVGEAEEGGVWVFGGAHRKYSEGKDHRELPQIHQGFPSDIFCVFSSEPGSPLSFLHPKWAHRQEHTNQIMTQSGGMWKIYLFFYSTDTFSSFAVRLSAGEWVLAPTPEPRPGRREAEPVQQRQLRPRLQRLPELLCCDRYNLTHARLIPKKNTHSCSRSRDICSEVVEHKHSVLTLLQLRRIFMLFHGVFPTVLLKFRIKPKAYNYSWLELLMYPFFFFLLIPLCWPSAANWICSTIFQAFLIPYPPDQGPNSLLFSLSINQFVV